MKIDMHVHTRGSDGVGTPEQIVYYALKRGLDGVVITDHHHTYTPEGVAVAEALRAAGVRAFHGCEYSTNRGHVLIYGVAVEPFEWGMYPDISKVVMDVLQAGGVAIPAHPFKPYSKMLGEDCGHLVGVTLIEGINGQCGFQYPAANIRAREAARFYDLGEIAGSDAHNPRHVGLAHTEFLADIKTDRDLVRELLNRNCVASVNANAMIEEVCRRRRTGREIYDKGSSMSAKSYMGGAGSEEEISQSAERGTGGASRVKDAKNRGDTRAAKGGGVTAAARKAGKTARRCRVTSRKDAARKL